MEFIGPAKRCVCLMPKPYRLDDRVVACSKCDGWFALEVSTPGELEAMRRRFPSVSAD